MRKGEWSQTRLMVFALCVTALGAALLIVRINPLEVSIAYLVLLASVIAVGLATDFWGGLLASAAGAFALVLFYQYADLYPRENTVLNIAGELTTFLLVGPLAGHLSSAVNSLHKEVDHWLGRAEELAAHDEVLGSLKPEWALARLEEEIERAAQFHRPLSALVIQVQPNGGARAENRRKRVAALQAFIRIAQAATQMPSVVTHLGSNRILVLLPEYTASQAQNLAQTLRTRWDEERCFPDEAAMTLGAPAAYCGYLLIGLSSLNGDKPKADVFLARAQCNEQGG